MSPERASRNKPQVDARTNAHDVAASFVGRTSQLAQIASYFAEGARLVSIVAPGGMGKTRVATRFAVDHAAEYSEHGGGGAWICDVTEARSATGIGAVVGSTLGVPLGVSARESDVVRELGRALANRNHMLLVLDNFEHVTEHAAATLGEWLRLAPSARFLVTSRVALNLPGEQLLSLEGLELPPRATKDSIELRRAPAVALFLERARSVRPELVVDASVLRTVADVVRRLDGMPLAIELAAARTFVLSVAEIRDRLSTSLDLLVNRTSIGRHASMRRVIADSYRLLDARDRACFSACAAFRGGFTLAAAEAVLGDDALRAVESLAAQSLVRIERGSPRRFSMYEPIRELSLEKFHKRTDAPEIARNHSLYFARIGTELASRAALSGGGAHLEELNAELENIVAAHEQAVTEAESMRSKTAAARALSLALALEPVLEARGLYRLRMRMLDQALRFSGSPKHLALRAEALVVRGRAHMVLGDLERAHDDFESALASSAHVGSTVIEAFALLGIGEWLELTGVTKKARQRYRAALARTKKAERTEPERSRLCRALAHERLGHVMRREGDLDGARREIERAISLFRSIGHDLGFARGCYEAAVIALFRRRYDEAQKYFAEGLSLARKIGARAVEGGIETARGSLLQEIGDLDGALALHAAAVLTFRDIGMPTREGNTLYYLAGAHLERGDRLEAEKLLAHALARVKGEHRYEALICGCRALVIALSGDFGGARSEMRAAEIAAKACAAEPTLAATIAIHRLHLAAIAEPHLRNTNLQRAHALAAESECDDPRFALRLFVSTGAAKEPDSLVIGDDGFRLPNHAFVDLTKRVSLRLLLQALAQKRIEMPGDGLALEELVAAAWPGERMLHGAAVNRVRVAMAELRKLGLRDALVSAERGYLVSPAISVTMAASAKRERPRV